MALIILFLSCVGWLAIHGGSAAAETSTPVSGTPTPVSQPEIGAALPYVSDAGMIDWTSSIGVQLPGRAIQDLSNSAVFPPLTTTLVSTAPISPIAVPQATQPASQPVTAQAPHTTSSGGTQQNASRTTSPPSTSAAAVHHGAATTGARHALSPASARPLHLAGYTPIHIPALTPLDTSGLLPLLGKFAVVLVLLFVCLRILRAVMPRQGLAAGRGGALVLFSESIGDKQRICLLDLQVKLALVSISNTAVTPITTIDDADQIASLRARYQPQAAARRREAAPARRAGRASQRVPGGIADAAPSFASVLRQEAGATAPQAGAVATSSEPTLRLPHLNGGQPVAPKSTHPGDLAFGQALATIRSLRQKVEQ